MMLKMEGIELADQKNVVSKDGLPKNGEGEGRYTFVTKGHSKPHTLPPPQAVFSILPYPKSCIFIHKSGAPTIDVLINTF